MLFCDGYLEGRDFGSALFFWPVRFSKAVCESERSVFGGVVLRLSLFFYPFFSTSTTVALEKIEMESCTPSK